MKFVVKEIIMFKEDFQHIKKKGHIEVVCGSMFSGKTEELIRRLKRAIIAKQKVQIFKPITDQRYHESNVVSHDQNFIPSKPVRFSREILPLISDTEVIGIDEAQFFDDGLVEVCNQLANDGKRVIIAGLDMDFKGNPFGPLPELLACADNITKVHAICVACGDLALYSYRKVADEKLVVLGEKDVYEPLCRSCFLENHK